MGFIITVFILVVILCIGYGLYFNAKYYTTAVIEQIDDRWFIKVGREYVDLQDMVNVNDLVWPMMLWKPESPYFQQYIGVYSKKYAEELLPRVQQRLDMDNIYVHQQGRFYYATKEGVYNWNFKGRSLNYLIMNLKRQNWSK